MQRLFKSTFIAAFLALLYVLPSLTHAADEPFRRWLDDGKTLTCTDMGAYIDVRLSNQNVEFYNLELTDEFTINYIKNGMTTITDGPYPVEMTDGTMDYNQFAEQFPSYPLTFEFRLDTLRDGEIIYMSSVLVTCTADGTFDAIPVNVIPTDAIPGTAGCVAVVPSGSVQGRLSATTTGLFEASEGATTNVVLPGGTSWWIIDSEPGFYKLWIACQAAPLWVPASVVGPNYDSGGASLP